MLDFGTGAGRAVLIDIHGRIAGSGYQEWTYETPAAAGTGAAEFSPESFWRILAGAARTAMQMAGAAPADVTAVTATSQRQGNVFLDAQGRAVLAVPNRDARAREEMARLPVSPEEIYERTAHWPVPIFAPLRLAWLRRFRPELAAQVSKILMIDGWLLQRMSGEATGERSSAAEMMLLDYRSGSWDFELAERLGVPEQMLPRLLRSGEVAGGLTKAAAADLNLRPGTPVTAGGGDTPCGVLGSGAAAEGEVVVVAGTTAPVQMLCARPLADVRRRTWTAPFLSEGLWSLESNAGGTGIALRWLRDGFYPELASRPDAFDQVCAEAEAVAPGAGGAVSTIGPSIFDLSRPHRGLRGFFVSGASAQLRAPVRAMFARALLEGNACGIRANIEQLEEVSGRRMLELRACGGNARSRLWLRMLAALLRRPVRVAEVAEATALGAAIPAAVQIGWYGELASALEGMARVSEPVEVSTQEQETYEAIYTRWRRVFEESGGVEI